MNLFNVIIWILATTCMAAIIYVVLWQGTKSWQKSYCNKWKYFCYICFFIGLISVIFGLSLYLDGPKIIGEQTIECALDTYNYTINDHQFVNFFICKNKPVSDYLNIYKFQTPFLISDKEIDIVRINNNKRGEEVNLYIVNIDNSWQMLDFLNFKKPYILFNWSDVPGNDSKKFVEFLDNNLSIKWAKNAKIEKDNYGSNITLFDEKNSLSLRFSEDKKQALLEINKGKTYRFEIIGNNSEQKIYYQWFNFEPWFDGPLYNEEKIELEDTSPLLSIKPYTSKYFVYSINTNETIISSINLREILIVKKFDFNNTWYGLLLFVTGIMIISFILIFDNPVDQIIIRISSITIYLFSRSPVWMRYKEDRMGNQIFIWKLFWGLSVIMLFLAYIYLIFSSKFLNTSNVYIPQDLKFLFNDLIIRYVLEMGQGFLVTLLLSIFIVDIILIRVFPDIFSWLSEKQGYISKNEEENKREIEIGNKMLMQFKNEVLSSKMLLLLFFITGILFIIFDIFNKPLLFYEAILILFPVIFFVIHKFIDVSINIYKDVGKTIDLSKARFEIAGPIISGFWAIIIFLTLFYYIELKLNNLIHEEIIGRSISLYYLNVNDLPSINIAEEFITENTLYILSILFALINLYIIFWFKYLLTPAIKRRRQILDDLREISLFFIGFISLQVTIAIFKYRLFYTKDILITSLILSILAYFLRYVHKVLSSQKV